MLFLTKLLERESGTNVENNMKNIHILPTNKLIENIYITSDEEPKHLDYYITKIKDSNGERYSVGQRLDTNDSDYSNCKKIILTTDQDLIKDGVQAIDDEFLEWFVKNPNYEEVEVERKDNWYIHTSSGKYWEDEPVRMKRLLNLGDYEYKIIIPQEESTKTHYLDEMPNVDKKLLAKMWEDTIPKVDPKREVFLMNAHGVIDTREPKQETLQEAYSAAFDYILNNNLI